ncbi:E3 ubiquitin-protein ligase synoviolin [Trifolium repens]|nr:E3 ubiquitin-protein ligase synoviolin [Trifolium repens]
MITFYLFFELLLQERKKKKTMMRERKKIVGLLFFFLFVVSASAGEERKSNDLDGIGSLGKKLVLGLLFGFLGVVTIIVSIGFIVNIVKEYWKRRARKIALQISYPARRERVKVSIYDTSDPPQFDQTECVVCLHEFVNTQTYSTLPCGHIFCEECMSTVLLKHDTCPTCRANMLD